tara:strand:- start:5210 stop:5434 length:225 start_codon:yes stop_codon:yes gene_type:complete
MDFPASYYGRKNSKRKTDQKKTPLPTKMKSPQEYKWCRNCGRKNPYGATMCVGLNDKGCGKNTWALVFRKGFEK